MNRLSPPGKKLVRHTLVGGICFALNLGILWLLVDQCQLPVLVATTVSFFVLNGLSHHAARNWVFRHTEQSYPRTLRKYFSGMALSLALNLALTAIAVNVLKIHYLWASTLIAALFLVGNFLLHLRWTFR